MVMQQSGSSIGALAAALAKAQIELVNPEKSMTATIRSDEHGGTEQVFHYAPLSSGLEILRKTLGEHDIAILQATVVDQGAGLVNLTTTLCHSSGEWVRSTWPVCSIDEMTSPKSMGAALTYARRYALFTLAGIAGEDDLDAPDLNAEPEVPARNYQQAFNGRTQSTGRHKNLARKIPADRRAKPLLTFANPALTGQLSAVLRDQLLGLSTRLTRLRARPFGRAAFFRSRILSMLTTRGSWRMRSKPSWQGRMMPQATTKPHHRALGRDLDLVLHQSPNARGQSGRRLAKASIKAN
jgi:hypothetical protein